MIFGIAAQAAGVPGVVWVAVIAQIYALLLIRATTKEEGSPR